MQTYFSLIVDRANERHTFSKVDILNLKSCLPTIASIDSLNRETREPYRVLNVFLMARRILFSLLLSLRRLLGFNACSRYSDAVIEYPSYTSQQMAGTLEYTTD